MYILKQTIRKSVVQVLQKYTNSCCQVFDTKLDIANILIEPNM